MQLPLSIPLLKSRQLLALMILSHGLAAGALLPLALPVTVRLALLGLVALSLFFTLYIQAHPPVVGLRLGSRGELEVERKVGAGGTAIQKAIIEPHTAILPGLIVLLLRCDGKRLALPLLPDSLDVDLNRQLRLWLQWRVRT